MLMSNLFKDSRIPKTKSFITFFLNGTRDAILLVSLGPNLIIGLIYGNPAVDIFISSLGTRISFLNENWKYSVVHILFFTIYFLLFLHSFAASLIITIYWDLTDRMLQFSSNALSKLHGQVIAKCHNGNKTQMEKIITARLTDICRTFSHQKIITANLKELIQTFVSIYIAIILPFLIVLIYITFRLSQHLNWPIFICILIVPVFWFLFWANVYICRSSLHENSNSFIKIGLKRTPHR